nr:MAG TPA: hypothetical protein [Caudoviricetes sp.]
MFPFLFYSPLQSSQNNCSQPYVTSNGCCCQQISKNWMLLQFQPKGAER